MDSAARTALPALDGVRVLDLTRVLAGPFCTMLLADAGAEVTKVESPHGDDARHLGPFRNGESVYFDIVNRRKRSICLDLKNPEDLRVFLELVRQADVVVENFRPGVTRRLGIDYDALAEVNPGVVYASISGFGQTGDMAGTAAYDLIVQALSGIMSITGDPAGGPTRIGESFGDLIAGVFGAWGITAALLERTRSGRGQHLDVSMFDSLLALQVTAFSQLQVSGRTPQRVGNRHPVSTPFDTFEASDGPVVIATASQASFVRLAEVIGRADLVDDPRFATDGLRTEHEPELKRVIEAWTSQLAVGEVVARLQDAGLAASPIWTLEEAVESAQARSRDLKGSFEHPVSGHVEFIRQPVRFGRSPEPSVERSPLLGEHTDQVRGRLSADGVAGRSDS